MKAAGQQNGFTLIELIVTLAVAAILVTAGIPSFQQFVQNNRRSAQLDALVGALQIARSQAISQRTTVGVCASSNSLTATPTCGTDWSKGWIVFLDKNGNGAVDSGEDMVRVFPALDGDNSLTPTLTGGSVIDYQSSGLSNVHGYFTLCDSRKEAYARTIIINAVGAVRTDDKTDSGGTPSCPT